MTKLGRNEPCTCGSGKKYKHCCLRQEEQHVSSRTEEHQAVGRALDWLTAHYTKEVAKAAAVDFFDCPERDLERKMATVPDHLHEMMMINLNAWLLADAALDIDGRPIRTVELLLGSHGPRLTQQGRSHLARLGSSSLSLYEVREVHAGSGVLIADLLDKAQPPIFVHEVSATNYLYQWDIIGARCTQQDNVVTFTGEIYPLPRERGTHCLANIQRKMKNLHSDTDIRILRMKTIIGAWLNLITAPPKMPIFVDNQTKELLIFTKDYYGVFDWRALEDILLAQEDIITEEGGRIWTHAEYIEGDRYRTLARLERMQNKDRLLVECNTRGKADAARKWLEGLAGKFVCHTNCRSVTPSQMLRASEKKSSAKPVQEETIPQEVQQQIIGEYMTRHYNEWPSVPLPALNGKTPLQATKLKTLQPKLVNILKQIEQGEARRARQEGTQAFDVSFLWKRLGLEDLR